MTAAPGIEVALTGRLGRPPEPRTTKAGNPMLVLNLAVDEGEDAPATWVRALVFGDDGINACRDLEPGARVYVEGRLRAEAYTPRDGGEPRVALTVLCRLAQPLGRIGRRRPQQQRQPQPARAEDEAPFDDVEALREIGR